MELPIFYRDKMKDLLGDEYEAYEQSLKFPGFRGLRVNTGKISTEKFEEISPFPCVQISWIPNGYYIPEDAAASKHPYYAAGLYYLQEPSAMTPARTLPIEPGDKVLDLCAAPGGKATELAARLKGKGLLVANDISNSRAKGLLKNLELFGFPNILVTSETPERLANYFPGYFDKILVDAPCSGEGMFRKDAAMIKSWEKQGPEYYAPLQREILLQAAKMLRPGGMLLYSTCTFDPMENEGTIQAFLNERPEFSVMEADSELEEKFHKAGFCHGRPDLIENGREELKNSFRLYPHKTKGEGHFLALIKKEGEVTGRSFSDSKENADPKKQKLSVTEPAPLQEFLTQICLPESFDRSSYELYFQQERVYALPVQLPPLKGLRFLRTGCYLGDLEKKRFTPSQALAMTLKKESWPFVLDLSAKDERVLRYLKGETLEESGLSEEKQKTSWCLVCVDGHPLGWAKQVNGSLRNKYYPGWRW